MGWGRQVGNHSGAPMAPVVCKGKSRPDAAMCESAVGRMPTNMRRRNSCPSAAQQLRRLVAAGRTDKFVHTLAVDSQAAIDGGQFWGTITFDGMCDILAEHLHFFRQKLNGSNKATHQYAPCPFGTVGESKNAESASLDAPRRVAVYVMGKTAIPRRDENDMPNPPTQVYSVFCPKVKPPEVGPSASDTMARRGTHRHCDQSLRIKPINDDSPRRAGQALLRGHRLR